jgi:hypothetical protein
MRIQGERGVVLGIILITAVIFGIAAFGLLSFAVNQAGQANFVGEDRIRARYTAESALVWAMQELWANPADCAFGPYIFDTNDDGTNDTTATVTAAPCPAPGVLSTLKAQVTF